MVSTGTRAIGVWRGFAWVFVFAGAALAGGAFKNAPDFTARELKGKTVSLKNLLEEGPVIVDFWATWCSPCNQEFVHVKKLYTKYKGQGLQVIAVSEDGVKAEPKVRRFVKTRKSPFIVIVDKSQNIQKRFGSMVLPTLFLIGTDGKIRATHKGYLPGDEKKLQKEVAALFSENNAQEQPAEQHSEPQE